MFSWECITNSYHGFQAVVFHAVESSVLQPLFSPKSLTATKDVGDIDESLTLTEDLGKKTSNLVRNSNTCRAKKNYLDSSFSILSIPAKSYNIFLSKIFQFSFTKPP